MADGARILTAGDTAVTIEFGDRVAQHLSGLVLALDRRFAAARLQGVVEVVPTLRSLTVHFDPSILCRDALQHCLEALLAGLTPAHRSGRRWTLPVCYEAAHAPDLDDVAGRLGLAPEEVIARHAGATYRVYMIGFLPGQPYMGDLPAGLQLPRREVPRTSVPVGSVAIATTLTTIYPLDSPGGWHLIGRTPWRLFDLASPEVVLLAPGDELAVRRIDGAEFEAIRADIAEGRAAARPEVDPS